MSTTSGLSLVVALNEASKELLDHAFQVRLRALDAIVRSAKQKDPRLAGFREVSHQMRRWSDELTRQLEVLRKLCAGSVTRESRLRTRLRQRALLKQTERQALPGVLDECLRRLGLEDQRLKAEQQAETANTLAEVEALSQLALMAIVLANSATIEAAAGADEERLVLTHVSREFRDHAHAVQECARRLLPMARRVREAA